jgi:hypothetical protein
MKLQHLVSAHVASLSHEAVNDWASMQIDEVMTDALYAACGDELKSSIFDAKLMAIEAARDRKVYEKI